MTTNSNDGPGKTRHLKDTATRCGNKGMRVICVHAADTAFRFSAFLPCSDSPGDNVRIFWCELSGEYGHCLFMGKPGSGRGVTRQQGARVFVARSDVSRLRELYSGDDGEELAEAIRQNCRGYIRGHVVSSAWVKENGK